MDTIQWIIHVELNRPLPLQWKGYEETMVPEHQKMRQKLTLLWTRHSKRLMCDFILCVWHQKSAHGCAIQLKGKWCGTQVLNGAKLSLALIRPFFFPHWNTVCFILHSAAAAAAKTAAASIVDHVCSASNENESKCYGYGLRNHFPENLATVSLSNAHAEHVHRTH